MRNNIKRHSEVVEAYLEQHAGEVVLWADCRELAGRSHLHAAVGHLHSHFGLTGLSSVCQEQQG